jgi:hypothetical protein
LNQIFLMGLIDAGKTNMRYTRTRAATGCALPRSCGTHSIRMDERSQNSAEPPMNADSMDGA